MIFLQKVNKKGIFIGSGQEASIGVSAEVEILSQKRFLKITFHIQVTESKPAVRAMSPERRNCLVKKETKTSLYEVAEVFRCLTSFCRRRWSSSPTTRSPAACLKTMSRSFWRIFSELSTKVPNFVYHSNSFFYQMPSLLHAKGSSLCDKDGNSIVHKRVHHLQVFFPWPFLFGRLISCWL